jgi:hypothetical protein
LEIRVLLPRGDEFRLAGGAEPDRHYVAGKARACCGGLQAELNAVLFLGRFGIESRIEEDDDEADVFDLQVGRLGRFPRGSPIRPARADPQI